MWWFSQDLDLYRPQLSQRALDNKEGLFSDLTDPQLALESLVQAID